MANQDQVTEGGPLISAPQQEQLQLEREKLAVERERLTLERERLAKEMEIERDKLALERKNGNRTTWSIVVPLLGAVFVAFLAYLAQLRATQDSFDLKLMEILMSGTAHEAQGKLAALERVFPDRIRDEVTTTFNADDTNWGRASKYKVLDLIAAQPCAEQRKVIVDTYKELFSKDAAWLTSNVVRAATSQWGSCSAGAIQAGRGGS